MRIRGQRSAPLSKVSTARHSEGKVEVDSISDRREKSDDELMKGTETGGRRGGSSSPQRAVEGRPWAAKYGPDSQRVV